MSTNYLSRKSFIVFLLTLLSFFFISFSSVLYPQFKTPVFENISVEDGLPENSVTCILQDYLGYLWLGTQNGLVRYDGYSMKVFKPENMNQEKMMQNGIVALYEDTEKTLWICTLNGLYKFNRSDETFQCYKNIVNDKESIGTDLLRCIYEDHKGRLWIGTQEGLSFFDRKKEKFTNYYFYLRKSEVITTSAPNRYNLSVNALNENPINGELLIGTSFEGLWKFNCTKKTFSKYKFKNNQVDKEIGYIQSFNIFKDKKIWMASYHTLCSLNPETGEFSSYIDFPVKKEKRLWKPSFASASIIKDYNGLIWCSFNTGGKGIFCLDPKTKYFQNYKPISVQHYDNYHNKIYAIYEDHSGIIWAGTWGTGLWKWDRRKNKFLTANRGLNSFKELKNFSATSFSYDSTGFIWFGSPRGLQKYDLKKGTFKNYLQSETCVTKYDLYTMYINKSGIIWLGTINCGLIRFNPVDGSYRYYFNKPNEPIILTNKSITNIYQDHLGFFWISTDGYGLYRFDTVKYNLKQFKHDPNDPSSLSQNQPGKIFEDSFNTLWIGTNLGGLNKFDRNTEKFIYCGFRCITQIYEDKKRNFWVGDYFTGLNLFDRMKNKVIKCYNQQDGLVTNSLWGILEDKHNNLWISTNNGLLKFNSETNSFKRYSKADGLPDNFFSVIGHCIGPNGTMLFNTDKGLVIFNPDSIKDDPVPPKVVIVKVSLFNRPDEKLNYEGLVSELKEIKLSYEQNDLRFDYVGLQFSEPGKNKYKYILENFDIDWIVTGNQRNATYTNLDPGEYVFKVMASNRDGVWNKEAASLKIIITPPWWETNPAYFFFALIFFGMIYFIWKMRLKRIKIKHEYEMSRFEAEKLHEVDELKSRFFTNISHEFRTPLTLILGPAKQVIEKINDQKIKNDLWIIHKNANKLLGLVNQLLEISKLESGNIKLRTKALNIITFIKAIVFSFSSFAERKNISLKFNSSEDKIIAYIDKEKIEKIITNILSNAFKFTPENGLIEVSVYKDEEYASIAICDTGIGIPEEKISKIFDRFYQVNGTHTREQEGTGIGLSLTKELVDLHKGKIEVESKEGKGTSFTISIPLGKEHLRPEEICGTEKSETPYIPYTPAYIDKREIESPGFELSDESGKSILLLVEDNSDVRNYIKGILKEDYKILEAVDGEDGWNKSIDSAFGGVDLIISDVMMPKMDGFKLCEKLKTDEKTSHIPVILLTAKASGQDKIEGFETGADEYIMKPFEPDELKARIKNLLEQRERIHNYFRNHGLFEIDKKRITAVNQKFLQKAVEIINKNISDPDFNVERFAESMAIHRSLLYKKVFTLVGEPPTGFMRRIRLSRAAELIEKKFGNITEIALEVGFNNPAYFSECFKKQFGVAPSQYNGYMS